MRWRMLWVIFLLAVATMPGTPVAAQGCEDCRELKAGLRGVTPSKLTPPVRVTPTTPVAGVTPNTPVVRAVLFWVKGCGHCEEVLDGILPQMQQKYGPRFEVRLVEVVTTEDIKAFYDLAESYGFPRGRAAVPFLLIGNQALAGEEQISVELPGLIQGYLAEGGVDWPAVTVESNAGQAPASADACDLATPCVDGNGASFNAPASAAAHTREKPSRTGIPAEALILLLVSVIGGGLVAVVGVRAVRRRRQPPGPAIHENVLSLAAMVPEIRSINPRSDGPDIGDPPDR